MLTHTIFEVYFYQEFFSFTTYLFIINLCRKGALRNGNVCLSICLFVRSSVASAA